MFHLQAAWERRLAAYTGAPVCSVSGQGLPFRGHGPSLSGPVVSWPGARWPRVHPWVSVPEGHAGRQELPHRAGAKAGVQGTAAP